ncbi:Exopolyphosphatase [Lentilactobacillus parabuchneri]|mgnify:FL=1|jgi:exopolyphosphatase/guanosine-5'-triphosphate,3'-diphosphate pyrophosphatase|uniref:exopolyphosphatase n=3 Tax=Lentilactobacillus parabuchneri TaxID=152331 RepID=A0A1X1FGS3_9LACO|nr:exopolyphosphatase [Lentilactobacillus parabuchneri]APR06857.1 Exopolyphosphatase [Lentilactobacillus parabuchneri]KRM45289.1 Ppx GppA phosphatase [Lentilactobacillus parabuchneri DSM 5707 = NBRC 107865]KRN78149.1 Ppx GppA phosphatase [Lentilactobacillus parabuchneri]MBW0224009.1 exopolyphosphatase [Lentilactobacillus parabuchneri]MBW0246395.1 exopolyphosphatase [Lentilactobacillus parabuchneri]
MENLAVIDLGSNSVRMTISRISSDGTYETVAEEKQYVRLSENMGAEKILQPEAIERTITALKSFKDIYSKLDHLRIKAVATAAVRQATNQKQFLKRVKNDIGINLDVISGSKEAYFDYVGVSETLPATNAVIIDTGGASAEIVLVQNGKVSNLISIPIGSVTLSAKFDLADEISAKEVFKAMLFVNKIFQSVWWLRNGLNLPIIGLGGSNRTLAKINRRFNNLLDTNDIHGYQLRDDSINETFERIIAMNLEERKKVPGINKERADIIVGGLIPVILLMNYLDSDRIMFSTSGLREGILFERLHDVIQENIL